MNREEIIKLAQSCGINFHQAGWPELERFAAIVAAAEREACAKVVEDIEARCIAKDVDDPPLEHVAAAIRARGQS